MKVFAITIRELGFYFASPVAYIIMTAFLAICGFFFTSYMGGYSARSIPAEYYETFELLMFLTILICPIVTMRLIAEEKARGTIETLFTCPVSEFQVVIGKFLASMVFYICLLLPTFAYVILLSKFTMIDLRAILTGYFGLLVFSATLFSIGLLVSAVFSSQVPAGITSLIISFAMIAMHVALNLIERGSQAERVLVFVSFTENIRQFFIGRFDTRPIVFFLSICVYCLVVTTKILELRRTK